MQFGPMKRNSSKIEIPHGAHEPINHSFMSPLKGTSFSVLTSSWLICQGTDFTQLMLHPHACPQGFPFFFFFLANKFTEGLFGVSIGDLFCWHAVCLNNSDFL